MALQPVINRKRVECLRAVHYKRSDTICATGNRAKFSLFIAQCAFSTQWSVGNSCNEQNKTLASSPVTHNCEITDTRKSKLFRFNFLRLQFQLSRKLSRLYTYFKRRAASYFNSSIHVVVHKSFIRLVDDTALRQSRLTRFYVSFRATFGSNFLP